MSSTSASLSDRDSQIESDRRYAETLHRQENGTQPSTTTTSSSSCSDWQSQQRIASELRERLSNSLAALPSEIYHDLFKQIIQQLDQLASLPAYSVPLPHLQKMIQNAQQVIGKHAILAAGATRNEISSLPTRVFRHPPSDQSQGYQSCTICLCEFVDGDNVCTLPCSHEYHATCIDSWLVKSRRCPQCRNEIA